MAVSEDYLAFMDTETGGLVPGRDPVIEIATILTDLHGVELHRIEMKVKLRHGDLVSHEAAAINGYNADVWAKEARPFSEYQDWLERMIPRGSVAIPVGNNVRFDRDMIDQGYYKPSKKFLPLSYRPVETMSLAMCLRVAGVIDVPDCKLGTIAAALGIPPGRAHSAMADTIVVKTIFERFTTFLRKARVKTGDGVPA